MKEEGALSVEVNVTTIEIMVRMEDLF